MAGRPIVRNRHLSMMTSAHFSDHNTAKLTTLTFSGMTGPVHTTKCKLQNKLARMSSFKEPDASNVVLSAALCMFISAKDVSSIHFAAQKRAFNLSKSMFSVFLHFLPTYRGCSCLNREMQGRVRGLQPVRPSRGESPQREHTHARAGATMEQNPLWQHRNSSSNGTLTTPECESLIADIRRTRRRVDADLKRSCARGKGRQG